MNPLPYIGVDESFMWGIFTHWGKNTPHEKTLPPWGGDCGVGDDPTPTGLSALGNP